ncbi:MAG TPA: HAD family phosphatase [Acidobacteriaceae bacterium]|nr:HAD family phosphatase [Acidobacteriaceae bacterium]
MPIRSVIFDYGEVLCTPDPDAYRQLLALTGLDAAAFDRCYWADRRDYDLGLFDGRGYWTRFAERAGIRLTPDKLAALVESDVLLWTHLSEPMLAWVAALQDAGMATAILSNMVSDVLRYMRQEFAWLRHFTQLTWSCELGIVKPDPAIYLYTCEQLSVAPADALFLDDKPENVRGAEQAGLSALRFTSIEQLRADLAARGWPQNLPQPGADEVPLPA